MKKILVVIFLLMTVSVFGQWTQKQFTYNAGVNYGFTSTLDSTQSNYTTPWQDWTLLDGQTTYFTYSLLQSHYGYIAGNDTIQVILQGSNGHGIVFNLDTLGAGSAGSEIIVSGITLSGNAGQVTISPVKYMPLVRLYVARKNTGGNVNGQSAIFYGSFYAKAIDTYIDKPKIQWN